MIVITEEVTLGVYVVESSVFAVGYSLGKTINQLM